VARRSDRRRNGVRMRSKREKGRQGGVKASNRAFEVRSLSSRRKNLVELLTHHWTFIIWG